MAQALCDSMFSFFNFCLGLKIPPKHILDLSGFTRKLLRNKEDSLETKQHILSKDKTNKTQTNFKETKQNLDANIYIYLDLPFLVSFWIVSIIDSSLNKF